jgi:Spy/CpxP family protein refolding chaperone
MKKLALALMATTFALSISALTVSAQTQSGVGSLHAQAQNFTPIVKQAACNGTFGPWCGPGWVRRCWRGPYGYPHCRCVPC